MVDHPSWNELLSNCFSSTEYLSLGTHGTEGVWVNPVYFAWDEHYNLFFISRPNCIHMDNIKSNAEVACTIYTTNQTTFSDVMGSYAKGTAKVLSDKNEKKIADDIYYGRKYPHDLGGRKRDEDNYRIDPDWYFVKITLKGLWYFDTRYFDERRVEIPKSIWSS